MQPMSRLVIPVSSKPLLATGDVRRWVPIVLLLRDGAGNYVKQDFRVDSASEITTFAAYDARLLGLVVPTRPAPVQHGQSSIPVRSGMFRFRIDGMDQTEYAVSCMFLGDPLLPPTTTRHHLLQPLALLQKLRFTMEKDDTGLNKHGQLIVETV